MWYFRPLDWLNFFLADVRGGLGPVWGVPADAGGLESGDDWRGVDGERLIDIALHTPIGALIDATQLKRGLVIGGACALATAQWPSHWHPPCRFPYRRHPDGRGRRDLRADGRGGH